MNHQSTIQAALSRVPTPRLRRNRGGTGVPMTPRASLPLAAGIGLRSPHLAHVQAERPPAAWFEVHSENYFADGGPALAALDRIRADYPLRFTAWAVARSDRRALPART